MLRDSRVSEHLDTKLITGSAPSMGNPNEILVKRRPFGRAHNRCVTERISQVVLRYRDPVDLGDVDGGFHPSASVLEWRLTNARSSRRGKEQTRSKISREVETRASDLMVGDNP